MKPVIQSEKHYIQVTLSTVTAGAATAHLIAEGVSIGNMAAANAFQVRTGANLKAVFVEMWVRAGSTSPGSVLLTLVKTVDGQTPTFADMAALNTYTNKKNVLYHTQGLTNDQDADAIPFVRRWFKIPKGKSRFGLGDRLYLVISAQAIDSIVCGFMVYKEYF